MKIFYNADIIPGEGAGFFGYLAIDGKRIAGIGYGELPTVMRDARKPSELIDCRGKMLMPGMIDCHVHFRQPGMEQKGTIRSESRCAVAGGVTSYLEMPNTNPPTTTFEAWEQKMALAANDSLANYGFFIGATDDNLHLLKELALTKIPGIKLFVGSSTGNLLVTKPEILDRIFAETGGIIAVHAEDEASLNEASAKVREEIGTEQLTAAHHPLMRPAEACLKATKAMVALAKKHHHRLHLCHLTSKAEIDWLSAQSDLKPLISTEVAVPHLEWCADDYPQMGNRLKINPSVKYSTDREALRNAVAQGFADTIGTDHAPHRIEEKMRPYSQAPSGAPSIQFALPALLDIFPPDIVVERYSVAPARIFGIEDRGSLIPGAFADFVIIDPTADYTVSDQDSAGICGWTPFAGQSLYHRVVATYVNGKKVYDASAARHFPTRVTPAMPLSFSEG